MANQERYAFAGCALDVSERRLSRAGHAITLAPKAYDLLVMLVRHGGRVLTKRELLTWLWPECSVDEGILSVHVAGLRKALGDVAHAPRYIETVRPLGYRFIAPVTRIEAVASGISAALVERAAPQPGRWAAADRVREGRCCVLSASLSGLPKAEAAFREAITFDATGAGAHAGLALVHCAEAVFHVAAPADAYGKAKSAALRALALDDSCADAHVALGAVMFLSEWAWIAAERSLRRALALDPDHSHALLLYGRLLEAFGQHEEGLSMKLKALAREPFLPLVHLEIAMSYFNQRRYDDAIDWAGKTLLLDETHALAREVVAAASVAKGDGRLECSEVSLPRAGLLGRAEYYGDGVLDYALRRTPPQRFAISDLHSAVLCSAAGEMDRAFQHLESAIDARDSGLLRLTVAPQWDNLRRDPRFDRCIAKMGLASSKHSTPELVDSPAD
jgi:DNA-binding winged helix-turn-helix (wHTH) protein